MKIQIWAGLCVFAIIIAGCGRAGSYFDQAETGTQESLSTEVSTQAGTGWQAGQEKECYVYVCGAVVQPGVYKLPAKSRIYEAIQMAGGLLESACPDSVNQAEEATDGQMVKILTQKEADNMDAQEIDSAQDGRVNLNTADAGKLMQLPGIGASKAESIISYRTEKGSFSSIEEIKNITGIKEGVYSKIKDYITVN